MPMTEAEPTQKKIIIDRPGTRNRFTNAALKRARSVAFFGGLSYFGRGVCGSRMQLEAKDNV